MRLPRHISILGTKYALERRSGLRERGLEGECSPEKRLILIDAQIKTRDETIDVLGHEIFHAYLYESSLHNLLDPKTEEALCDLVGRLLRDGFNLRKK